MNDREAQPFPLKWLCVSEDEPCTPEVPHLFRACGMAFDTSNALNGNTE